jgi:hypothetical protein
MILKINMILIRALKVFWNSHNVTNTWHTRAFLVVLCKLKGCLFETKLQHLLIYSLCIFSDDDAIPYITFFDEYYCDFQIKRNERVW